jgi:hypothetical protein
VCRGILPLFIKMTIIKKEHYEPGEYTILAKAMITSQQLSFGARGVYAYLMSKPADWVVRMGDLEKQTPTESKAAVRRYMKELQQLGLADLVTIRDKGGRVSGKGWALRDLPETTDTPKTPTSVKTDNRKNRTSGKPNVGKTERREVGVYNNKGINTDNRINTNKGIIQSDAPEKKQLEIVQLNAAQNTPPLPGGGEIFEEVEEVEVEHLDELPLHISHANKIKAYFCDYEQARVMICQSARWEGSLEQFNAEVDKFAAYYANERQHHLERCADNPRRYAGAALQRWLSQSKNFKQSKFNTNGKQQIVKGASKEEQRQSIAEYLRNRRADG